MTTTLLVDLDNTLLSNDMDTFLPAYLQALSTHLAPYAEPKRMVQKLLEGTRRMVENRRPDCRLIEIFNSVFYPALGSTAEEMQAVVEEFYQDVFPSLKILTRPRPEAVQVIEQAFTRGYRVVIATNPLFPYPAILHRLDWAGLSVEKYPFDLVVGVEDFHFSKPHPEFPAECLGSLGWPDGRVVMVGDHPVNDIRAARLAGLATFWISSPDDAWPGEAASAPTGRGPIAGLLPWLDQQAEEELVPDFSDPNALLAVLRVTPALLNGWLRDLPQEDCGKRRSPQEWSLTEILCHLRDVEEEVNLPRLRRVFAESNPFLPGVDTDPWAEERQYAAQNSAQALGRFTEARIKLLYLLESQGAGAWQRPARHAILGPARLVELVGIIASHDRLHIRQVRETLRGR